MIAAVAAITSLAVLVLVLFIVGVVTGHLLQKYQHKLPCCMTLRSSELDEVLVVNKAVTEQIQTKAATEGRQRIAISASTTQSLESSAGAFNHGPAGFTRTASVELGDIYRTASAISVFLEEADARPFINRLMSMPVMNADGVVSRPVIDASTINPNIEVSMDEIDLAEQIGRGGFGAVYKGTWRGASVAVKYAVCNVQDVDSIEGAIREVVLSKKMSHPNVVQTYAWTVLDGSASVVAQQDADTQRTVLQRALQGAHGQDSQSASPKGGSTPSGKEPSGTSQRRQRRSSMGPDLLSGSTRPGHSRPGNVRRHRRSSLGPSSMRYADIEQRLRDTSHSRRVRRSASSVTPRRHQLQEPTPSRLSPHAEHGCSPAVRRDRLSWENELLQMQIASSALIKPLGNAESASIADPRIIAKVTHQAEESSCLNASVRLQSQCASERVQEHQTGSGAVQSLQEGGTASPSSRCSLDVQAQNARSISSPFFAAAQHFALTTSISKAPPPPLCIPDDDDPQAVCVGLALQRQTETTEVVIPPPASFTSMASPTLPELSSAMLPLSPQTTAKGFLTADSFKHEPGTTLLDCTDPTPSQSIDLDDSRLKNRLAQLLPDFSFPPNKRVKRNLSNQLCSLSEGEDDDATRQQAGPLHHDLAPDAAPHEGTGSCEATALNTTAHPSHWKRASETTNAFDGEGSLAGSIGDISFRCVSRPASVHADGGSSSGDSRPLSPAHSQELRRGTAALRADLSTMSRSSDYESDRMRVDTTAASFTSFNSEEGFGSPVPRRNKDRPTVFDMEDNDLKGHDTVIVVVMEFCDLGSLLRAVNKKAFKPHGKWSYHTTYRALLRTAQEVAKGMDYIHSFGIIHGDLKLGNVLLKTHRVDRRGYVAKVSDFGLSRPLQESEQDVPAGNHVGTIMYTAPEVFRDSRLTKPGDVYAFGIMMWEMFYCEAAYDGLMEAQICLGVCDGSLRPQFNETCPLAYQKLATQCWAQDPEARPTFQQLVEILTEIEVEFRRECHRQRPAMAVGVATNSPSPGRRRSVGFGGVPLPHGARKPPTRFGSGLDLDAASFSASSATPMLRAASSAQSEAFTKATAVPSSRQS